MCTVLTGCSAEKATAQQPLDNASIASDVYKKKANFIDNNIVVLKSAFQSATSDKVSFKGALRKNKITYSNTRFAKDVAKETASRASGNSIKSWIPIVGVVVILCVVAVFFILQKGGLHRPKFGKKIHHPTAHYAASVATANSKLRTNAEELGLTIPASLSDAEIAERVFKVLSPSLRQQYQSQGVSGAIAATDYCLATKRGQTVGGY